MRKNTFKAMLTAGFCLLLLVVLLLLAACGGYSPGSPNNGTPQATPTGGGYSMVYHIDRDM